MRIIRPALIEGDALVTSSVTDTPPAYNAATVYQAGDRVQDPVQHREYESAADNNSGKQLSNVGWWLDKGPTNRWRMFDQSIGTQTVVGEVLEVDVLVASRVNAVTLLNVEAAAAQITAFVGDRQVYDRTFQLTAASGITDWYSYFFEPIELLSDLVVTDLPTFSRMKVRVRLTRPGGMVKIGALIVGQLKDLGLVEEGVTVRLTDFSRKEVDEFGNASLVPRAFARKLDARVLVDKDRVDSVRASMEQYRATSIVWIADDRWATTIVYGFFREFSTTFPCGPHVFCLLEIEGIT